MNWTPDWTEVHPEHKWKILRRQSRFGLWALFSSIGGMMLGFDWGVTGTVTALHSFQKQYGHPDPTQPSGYLLPANYLSGWSAASSGGDIIGILLAGTLINLIGRKHSLLVGALITTVGIGMQYGSSEWILFLCGRLVNALGFGIVYIVSPVWIGETVRPELRGFYLCLMNGAIVFGQFLLAVVGRGVSEIEGKWSHQTMILLQFAFCLPLIGLYPWFPESPYFLLDKGHEKAARKSLKTIHGPGDQALIDAEVVRIQHNISFNRDISALNLSNKPRIIQAFQKPNLKRTLISNMAPLQQQCVGSTFILAYITYFLSILQINDFFTVSLVLTIVMLIASALAFPLIEVVGRRRLLVPGTFVLTGSLLIMGITGCFSSKAATWIFLVSIFLWAFVYECTLGAVGFAFGAEIPSLPMRGTNVSLMGFTQMACVWVVSLVLPYLINPDAANLGPKVCFVFFGLSLPLCIAMFFFIPETKGLSFQEMDYLFVNGINYRRFPENIAVYREEHNGGLVLKENNFNDKQPFEEHVEIFKV